MSQFTRDGELLVPVKKLVEPVFDVISRIDGRAEIGGFAITHDIRNRYFSYRIAGDYSRSAMLAYRYGFERADFSLHDDARMQMVSPHGVIEMLSKRGGPFGHSVGYSFNWNEQGDLTSLRVDFGNYQTVDYSARSEKGGGEPWEKHIGRWGVPQEILDTLPPYLEGNNLPVLVEGNPPMQIPWKNTEEAIPYSDATPARIFRRAGLPELAKALEESRK